MPVLNQSQKSNVISSSSIKTMRKDLQRLREADVVKESQKIIQAKPADAVQIPKVKPFEPVKIASKPKPTLPPSNKMPEVASKLPKAVEAPRVIIKPAPIKQIDIKPLQVAIEQRSVEEQKAIEQAKQFATETEKQQIFLLESQLKNLQQQLQVMGKEQEPRLELEKNEILLGQESQQKLLQPLLDQEAKLETQQQAIEQEESQSTVPAKKQELEQRRWKLEEQHQVVEKKRWAVEKELAALEARTKTLEEDYAALNRAKTELVREAKDMNGQIKDIARAAIGREKARRESQKQEIAKQSTQQQAVEQKKIEHEKIAALKNDQKQFTQNISTATKEKFVASVKNEEERRRKFLEDIEAWAASQKEKQS